MALGRAMFGTCRGRLLLSGVLWIALSICTVAQVSCAILYPVNLPLKMVHIIHDIRAWESTRICVAQDIHPKTLFLAGLIN